MHINRRHFLKNSSATVALPLLPSLLGAQTKEPKPSKKLIFYYIPNGICRRTFFPGEESIAPPGFKGGFSADLAKKQRIKNKPGIYPLEFTSSLQTLKGLKNDFTMITGLDRTFKNGQDVHEQGSSAYLTSLSPEMAKAQNIRYPQARTLDHVIGDVAGLDTAFRTLEISTNGFAQGKEGPFFDNISWYDINKVAPSIKSPRKLYDRLFKLNQEHEHFKDITDLVLSDAKSLQLKLGRDDQRTMDEFMDMIRSIEIRNQRMEKLITQSKMDEPTDSVLPRGQYIRLMEDMLVMALQMGITNISTFMVGPERWDAALNYEGVFDKPVNHHSLTHNQKGDGYLDVQKVDIFHLQQWAHLLERMKQTKESDGSSLLDNSIVTYGACMGDGATHQFFDLPMLVAGKAQGQIKQGRFIKCKSGTLNSNLWLTIAQLMGLNIDSYADSHGTISELRA